MTGFYIIHKDAKTMKPYGLINRLNIEVKKRCVYLKQNKTGKQ